MVICEKGKFVFIRIPKNASTSLASFFVKSYCDSNDIYTAIGDAHVPTTNVSQNVINKYRTQYRFIHLTLDEIVNNGVYSEERLEDKRIIGVIREPLDRQLSLFFFLTRSGQNGGKSVENFRTLFSRGFCGIDQNNTIPQTEYMTLNDVERGEYWLYDHLDNHLNDFIQNHPTEQTLPTYKSNIRKNQNKLDMIDEYYDQKTLDAVKRYYEKDFELYEAMKNGTN